MKVVDPNKARHFTFSQKHFSIIFQMTHDLRVHALKLSRIMAELWYTLIAIINVLLVAFRLLNSNRLALSL